MYNKLSKTHMHNQSNSHGCYHFIQSDIKKLVFDPWGNEMWFAPNDMKFDPMAKNSQLLNMKHILYINFTSFIHKSSILHTYIRFYQVCRSLQQGIGEMALFLQYWTIIHEISCPFHLRYF